MSNGDVHFVPPTHARLRVMRDGHNIVRRARIPKPVVLVDTRERTPWPLCANHPNWVSGERRVTLETASAPGRCSRLRRAERLAPEREALVSEPADDRLVVVARALHLG